MRSTSQILGAPFGAFYIVSEGPSVRYFEALAVSLGRGDVRVVPVRMFVDYARPRGVSYYFVVDHEVWVNRSMSADYITRLKSLCRPFVEAPPSEADRISQVLATLVAGFISELDEKGETRESETAQLALKFLNDDDNKGKVAYFNETTKSERVKGFIDGGGTDLDYYLRRLNPL